VPAENGPGTPRQPRAAVPARLRARAAADAPAPSRGLAGAGRLGLGRRETGRGQPGCICIEISRGSRGWCREVGACETAGRLRDVGWQWKAGWERPCGVGGQDRTTKIAEW
jgi:hypothetical protein